MEPSDFYLRDHLTSRGCDAFNVKLDSASTRVLTRRCRRYLGHLLIENRHGLIADARATVADGFGEREAATGMLHDQWQRAPGRRRTLGADKAYDDAQFVELLREINVTPHVTENLARPGGSAIDGAPRVMTAKR